MCSFNTRMLEMVPNKELANSSIMSHSQPFLSVVRTVMTYSLSKFQMHNTVLITVTMLYLDPATANSCYNWKSVPSDQHLPIFPTP